MRFLSRHPQPRRPRALLLVAVLLLTLGLAGLLAYEAQDAARSHRAAAESALRDYAAFAAWAFRRDARSQFGCLLHQAIHPIAETRAHDGVGWWYPGPMPEPEAPDSSEICACSIKQPRFHFRLDLRGGGLMVRGVRGTTPEASLQAWVQDTVTAHALTEYDRSQGQAALVGTVDGRPQLVVYKLEHDSAGAPIAAYGLGAKPDEMAPTLKGIAEGGTLLPPSLTEGLANKALLSARIAAAEHEVYRTPVQYASLYTAEERLSSEYGGLRVQIALNPAVAERLLIGGVPQSRLPILLGLLALATAFVVVALRQLRREHELASLRADFVSGTSHELRTPLAQIRMFAETLLLGRIRSEAERRRSAEIIVQEARRLTHLVENVLHFSRAERRRGRIEPEPTDLASLVREVAECFAPLARPRGVELRTTAAEGIVACVDRDALRQMLLNLLDNAVKYGPRSQTVTIGLALTDATARIQVDDEGPGIPARERERIWDSFSRLERDAESAVAGSGIGLAVVRELAALHGGRAWVEDAPGGGARFVVELPDARRRLPAAVCDSVDVTVQGNGAKAERAVTTSRCVRRSVIPI